jgi:hypothetical protein
MTKTYFKLEDLFDDFEDEMELYEEPKFCNWVFDRKSYSPAVEIEIVKSIAPGVYKIDNDYKCIPQTVKNDELYILSDSKIEEILKEVEKFWSRKAQFKKTNFMHKRGILLEGPAGTGKTSIISLLCESLVKDGGVVFLVNNVQDFTKVYDFLKNTFRKIEPERNIITIIEDVDKLVKTQIEAEILDFLDGKASIEHHLVVLTTNNSEELPENLLRASRVDKRFVIDLPTADARRKYFQHKKVVDADLDKFVNASNKLSLSQLKELFLGTYVLGNDFDEVLDYLKTPIKKKNYLENYEDEDAIGYED